MPYGWYLLQFLSKNDVWCISTLICFVGGSFFYKCYLYLFTHTGIQYDFHIRWWSWHWTATWWVPLVKQELFTLFTAPEFIPGFQWDSCCSIFSFLNHCWVFLSLFFCLIYFWILHWYLQTFLELCQHIYPNFN